MTKVADFFREILRGCGCLMIILILIGASSMFSSGNKYSEGVSDYSKSGLEYGYEDNSYFRDYECTEDCSGHEAGYEWAMDHDICDPDDCGGNSTSFTEGCMSYAIECQEDNYYYYDEYEGYFDY